MANTRIHEQLGIAFDQSGLTCRELAKRCRMSSHSQLIRKLAGEVPLTTREAERIADALARAGHPVKLEWPKKRAA